LHSRAHRASPLVHELEADTVDPAQIAAILPDQAIDAPPVGRLADVLHRRHRKHILREISNGSQTDPVLEQGGGRDNDV
jgi:hypothetical protein